MGSLWRLLMASMIKDNFFSCPDPESLAEPSELLGHLQVQVLVQC